MAPRNNRKQNNMRFQCDVEQHPVLRAFKSYAAELDSKHDRYERIIKLSRDITIESKRVIFLLHSIDSRKKNRDKILIEAQHRLNKLIETNFNAVASELKGEDIFQYRGAYSPGLQEFIEAYTFMEYMKSEDDKQNVSVVSDWIALQQIMQYDDHPKLKSLVETNDVDIEKAATEEKADFKPTENKLQFIVEPTEYILGLSDLTGELMRRCINSLGSGDTETCMETCKVLQQFYTGYFSLNLERARDIWRKIVVMRQSLLKVENVCYYVKVRGGEAAKWGSVFDQKAGDDLDEGFY